MAAANDGDIQASSKLKLVKWKVRKESHVFKGTVLALYSMVGADNDAQIKKLKANYAGVVVDIPVKEGEIANQGEVLLRMRSQVNSVCSHATIMKDMCAECGMDLRETLGLPGDRKTSGTASVAMVHSIPELIVSQEQAMEIGKEDENRLLRQRKLVLLVDLDQTLIHTTNDNIPPNLKDVKHFQLWHGKGYMWYHTRFRPFTQRFIETVSKMYELHICTFGVRMYAHIIARLLDPDEKYFSHRILSRDECFDAMSKTANLKALFPCGDKTVCIIDDREDVWNFAPNLVHVKPYRFFQGTADINAPPGLTKKEHDSEPLTHKVVDPEDKVKAVHPETESASAGKEKKELSVKKGAEKAGEKSAEKEKLSVPADGSSGEAQSDEQDEAGSGEGLKESGDADEVLAALETGESLPSLETEISSSGGMEQSVDVKDTHDSTPAEEVKDSATQSKAGKDCKDKGEANSDPAEEIDWDDTDDYLLHLEEILTRIHTAFYDMYGQSQKKGAADLPDLKSIIPYVRKKVLKGANIVFSGMVPLNMSLEKSRAYIVATALGASVHTDIVFPKTKGEKDPNATTHLVAAKAGTGKHKSAMKVKGLHIVQADWLWACSERWEWVTESLFPLINSYDAQGSKNEGSSDERDSSKRGNHKRKHGKRKENHPQENEELEEDDEECISKRQKLKGSWDGSSAECETVCKAVDINPMYSFSDEDILTMDKEVDDVLAGEEDDSSDETDEERDKRVRKQVLGSGDESDSDSDSLSGDFPRGWRLRRKSLQSAEAKEAVEEKEEKSAGEDDEETENELERYQKNMAAFSPQESSTSASDDSIGSVDDEIADAVEREFLSSL